ncbi:MAG: hypothetical protein D6698_15780 [Gammaproteobacteria bacterium]|nr:MAG: hypothetical protein D6698_15780 [Gammaproteobacteria bacterium]
MRAQKSRQPAGAAVAGVRFTLAAQCWICGALADSREHLVKASDLRLFFGDVSPCKPLHLHHDNRRNIKIYSAKSNKLKTSKVICRRCNDTDTSNYDEAWSRLIRALHRDWQTIKITRRFKLQRAFPGTSSKQALNCHLFFVKLFGCRIVDEKMPIDVTPFAFSLRSATPHPTMFLTFNARNLPEKKLRYAGVSAVEGHERFGVCTMASWYYTLAELDVQVTWFNAPPVRNVPYAWHPSKSGKILKFRPR